MGSILKKDEYGNIGTYVDDAGELTQPMMVPELDEYHPAAIPTRDQVTADAISNMSASMATETTLGVLLATTADIEARTVPANAASNINTELTTADTEYEIAIPGLISRFILKCRTSAVLKLSYTTGQSGTNYITLPANGVYSEDNLDFIHGISIFVQSPTAGVIVETAYFTATY